MRYAACLLSLAVALILNPGPAQAQDDAAANHAPGLILTLTPQGQPAAKPPQKPDARVARLPSLYLPAGESPSPFLAPGPFQAVWKGFVNIDLRGRYTFHLQGRGQAKLIIDGQTVLQTTGDPWTEADSKRIRLSKGANPVQLHYTPPAQGPANIRLYWTSYDFPREPVPATALTHDPADPTLQQGQVRRMGRTLVAQGRCLHCHTPENGLATILSRPTDQATPMPELAMDAPNLTAVGDRLHQAWMERWLADPQAVKHNATMPQVLDGPQDAADVAAFLATLKTAPQPSKEPQKPEADAKAGGALFARLGCVGCHLTPGKPAPENDMGRLSLAMVAHKYKPGALKDFLQKPDRHYAWIRMPDFALQPQEAAHLAAYLLKHAQAPANKPDNTLTGDAARGRLLVASSGCMNCHVVDQPGLINEHEAPSLDDVLAANRRRSPVAGCLHPGPQSASAAAPKAPKFGFDEAQASALQTFMAEGLEPLTRTSPPEFAARQVHRLRCVACHQADRKLSDWTNLEDEIAHLLPESHGAVKAGPADTNSDNAAFDDPPADGFDDPADDPFNDDPSAPSQPGQPQIVGGGAAVGGDEQPPIDQTRPQLTWMGEKLRPNWAAAFIRGDVKYKPRPWLHARMPAFRPGADILADGLAQQHGLPPAAHASKPPAPDQDLAKVGRKLIDRHGGFSCNLCHAVGETKALNVFEAQGPNFMYVRERLNREYYHRWMQKPARIMPTTKMPQFANEQGQTPLYEFFDGDAEKQFEAIWQHLLTGRNIKPPK